MTTTHTRPHRGATDVWITPPWLTDALGPFDLDPCGSDTRPWDHAKETLTEGGLEAAWEGRVWVNPPYGPQSEPWLEKLADHGTGTALVFARTETRWFVEQVWAKADAILFLYGRLHFHKPNGDRAKGNSGGPSCLVAYGWDDMRHLADSGLRGAFVTGWRR